ncbi:LacI family DNA-binding transcriptional regulator [Zhihengliuella sp.]|uniref:LacI family DNA-binding transcriptional regulator n=1 Tax=Zhihengliuella sp. TaxID=1954483 RepID=UPI0028112B33|nr:LacI family DNA-binding transcriptional regulator [Zhihengliuella sp.]
MTNKPAKRSTIADVAAEAGVSTATAGRVLGGYGYASQDIRTRVQRAARKVGYRPNRLARGLITGRTQTLGVVAADIGSPYYAAAMRGISDVAERAGFGAIITNSDEDADQEIAAVELLLEKQVDGLIVSTADPSRDAHLRAAIDSGRPVVQLDRAADALAADAVVVDGVAAARSAVELLLDAGHRRIAFVGELEHGRHRDVAAFAAEARDRRLDGRRLYPSWQRLLGYLEAHWAAGAPVDPRRVLRVGAYSAAAAAAAVGALLAEPPARGGREDDGGRGDDDGGVTALFAADGVMSTGTVAAVAGRGLAIPGDVSVVCFDDLDWMEFTGPGLTTVAQPVRHMGELAATTLLARIGGDDGPPRRQIVDTELVLRGSVGPPAA